MGETLLIGGRNQSPVLGVDLFQERGKVRRYADGHSENPKHLIRPVNRGGLKVPFPTPDLRQALGFDEALLACAQLLLRLPALHFGAHLGAAKRTRSDRGEKEHRGIGHHPVLRNQLGKRQTHGYGSEAGAKKTWSQTASPDAQDECQKD